MPLVARVFPLMFTVAGMVRIGSRLTSITPVRPSWRVVAWTRNSLTEEVVLRKVSPMFASR
jgi:hypothetical protein